MIFIIYTHMHIDGGMAEYISVLSASLVHGEDLPVDALAWYSLRPMVSMGYSGCRCSLANGCW